MRSTLVRPGATQAHSITARALRLAAQCLLPAALLLAAGPAHADFFDNEPGVRIKGHQGLDCKKCHTEEANGDVDRNRCLSCHDHRDLRAEIDAKKGVHARKEFLKSCGKCHADHKGAAANVIDWKPLGGRDAFDHSMTGYELQGAHAKAKCTDCHKAKFAKSGTPRFLGLDQKCLSCHEDIHNFTSTRRELSDCTLCHTFDARAVGTPKQIARTFNHDKVTGFGLRGAHDDLKCTSCHAGGKSFKMAQKPQGCASCHKDPHKNVYTAENRTCEKCHAEENASWKQFRFDHNKTRFPLTFSHGKQGCTKCHSATAAASPSMECISCHKKDDPHVVGGVDRFAAVACIKCHTPAGFNKPVPFEHNKETRMELAGRHAQVSCTTCHRARPKDQVTTPEDAFEKFKDGSCIGCHAHENAHQKSFHEQPDICVKCHVPGTDNLKIPAHNKLTNAFAQAGAHQAVSCEKCHGEGLKKLKVGSDCTSCHEDKHNGTLGGPKDCVRCHTEGMAFKLVKFDHTRDTKYPLQGRHAAVACAKCHQKAPASYQVPDKNCAACHAGQDIHAGKLGNTCDKCHTPTGGAPKFNHNTMTRFQLADAHARSQCVGCHQQPIKAADEKPKLDWSFKSKGGSCKDCHGDPHGISANATCSRCHGTEDFRTRVVDRYHDVPPFSLTGNHARLECTKCHGQTADLTGVGIQCATCHRQDDPHGGALRECQYCHRVQGWQPSSFTHVTTGFPLQGVHRTLDCRQCHGTNQYSGMSSECVSCHLQDFMNPRGRVFHSGLVEPNCLPCHNQVSWVRGPRGRNIQRNLP